MKSTRPLLLLALIAATGGIAMTDAYAGEDRPSSNRLYKWVDDSGVTHYGETVPPEYQNHESVEMNKRGVVLRKQDRALTPAEIKQKDREVERKKQEVKQAQEQTRRDKALLATYTTENQLEETRERHLMTPLSVIKTLEPQIQRAQDRVDELRKKSREFSDKQKPVPESVREELDDEETQVQSLQIDMARKRSEADSINARFDADKRRFRELKGVN